MFSVCDIVKEVLIRLCGNCVVWWCAGLDYVEAPHIFLLGMYHKLKKRIPQSLIPTPLTVLTKQIHRLLKGHIYCRAVVLDYSRVVGVPSLCPPPVPTCNVHCTHEKS